MGLLLVLLLVDVGWRCSREHGQRGRAQLVQEDAQASAIVGSVDWPRAR
jgi:hypothetical protein